MYSEETAVLAHIERAVKAVLEECEIDEPFFCSWAYTCDRQRVDEFGGGAFAVQRGKDTLWIDAMSAVRTAVLQ